MTLLRQIQNPYAPPKAQHKNNPDEQINKRLTVSQLKLVQNLMHANPEAGLKLYAQLCEANVQEV